MFLDSHPITRFFFFLSGRPTYSLTRAEYRERLASSAKRRARRAQHPSYHFAP